MSNQGSFAQTLCEAWFVDLYDACITLVWHQNKPYE